MNKAQSINEFIREEKFSKILKKYIEDYGIKKYACDYHEGITLGDSVDLLGEGFRVSTRNAAKAHCYDEDMRDCPWCYIGKRNVKIRDFPDRGTKANIKDRSYRASRRDLSREMRWTNYSWDYLTKSVPHLGVSNLIKNELNPKDTKTKKKKMIYDKGTQTTISFHNDKIIYRTKDKSEDEKSEKSEKSESPYLVNEYEIEPSGYIRKLRN